MKNTAQRADAGKRREARKKATSATPRTSAIAQFGLNPDFYDDNGDPIIWTDPDTGAMMGGDPAAFDLDLDPNEGIQIIGSPEAFANGAQPQLRPMRLSDLDDDCDICRRMRKRILSGNAPMVMAFE